MFISSTHDRLLMFTNFGKVYRLMGYEIPEAQKQGKGRAIIVNIGDITKKGRIKVKAKLII